MDFFDIDGFAGDDALASRLGWTGVIKPVSVHSKDVQQEARRVRKDAEVVIASGNSALNRLASDCWEMDAIGSSEMHEEKDFMHQMNSGIDYVIARACAEKGIAVELRFSNVLNSSGRKRAQILARMAQNVMICRDCGCDIIITSGAIDKYGLRNPRDLMALGIVLGMTYDEAKAAVSLNPQRILKRGEDRRNPNIILKGLEVKRWGSKPKEKKVFGWY